MALTNAEHEEFGTVILNKETNQFVIGSIGGNVTEFVQGNGGILLYRSGYDSHEAYMHDIEETFTEFIAELEADGYSTQF